MFAAAPMQIAPALRSGLVRECLPASGWKRTRRVVQELKTPVSVKIRIFPELEKTLQYAKMLEQAGASLVAVHGRTRDQKDASAVRADWDAIKAVKAGLSVPVLGNGNVRTLADVHELMAYTGVDGVMSAESLLDDPALFWSERLNGKPFVDRQRMQLALEYLDSCESYPVPMRMVRVRAIPLRSS
jgi:tRNA-dihydrouridine synthase 1